MKRFISIFLMLLISTYSYAADSKVSGLTELATEAENSDILYIVDDPAGTPTSKKITVLNAIGPYLGDIKALTPVADNLLGWNAGATDIENKSQLTLQFGQYLEAEGATADAFEILLDFEDPVADRTVKVATIASDAIEFVIDGGGSAITTGTKGYIEIPWDCTITSVTMLADQSGSIVVDLWVDTYANYPPTDADSITASAVPTISTATKSQDNTLTGWTTSLTKGSIIGYNVDSATTVEITTISLKVDL